MVENSAKESVDIDGSLHEGGGQIVRNTMALCNILQVPCNLENIRSGRPNPGINNQIMGAIELMGQITKAKAIGAKVKSLAMYYEPTVPIISDNYKGGSQTASAISLMFQSLVPTLIFGKKDSVLTLEGGTDVNKSPPSESVKRALVPLMSLMGIDIKYVITKDGFFPRGGGKAEITIKCLQQPLKPVQLLQKNNVSKVYIKFLQSNTDINPKDFLKALKTDIKQVFKTNYPGIKVDEDVEFGVEIQKCNSKQFKSLYGIVVLALGDGVYYDCSFFPDDKNCTLEQAHEEVIKAMEKQTGNGGCLDDHHQDQLLIYMALANGVSRIRVSPNLTDHSKAGIYIIEKFIPNAKIKIIDVADENNFKQSKIIEIQGIGFFQK